MSAPPVLLNASEPWSWGPHFVVCVSRGTQHAEGLSEHLLSLDFRLWAELPFQFGKFDLVSADRSMMGTHA